MDSRAAQLSALRDFCSKHAGAVLFDEPAGLLTDVASGRSVALDLPDLQTVEPKAQSESGVPYLWLSYATGRRLALTPVGIAFPPDFRQTGPVRELPELVSLTEHGLLLQQLKSTLYAHPDQASKGTVRLLLMGIAIIDGARAAGLDVTQEARELEHHLSELEKRAPPKEG
ncbi:MAG TPA: hypothetical protein VK447_00380 [Myxococcaceae bacterium]|nr:hypothetical protein [Myxococcaceae bacterium]